MQPDYEITFNPIDLRIHGINPHGKPVYRVVWADSRRSKVIHKGKIVELPRYYHGDESSAAGKWVLEKWVHPDVLLGMTREQYAGLIASVPNAAAEEYPEHGDYELSYVFVGNVDADLLHKQLFMHEHNFLAKSDADRAMAIEAAEDEKDKLADEKFDDVFEEAKEMIQ
jgi:hypothetical protein